MCFPSKWLKKNFVEEETPRASSSKPTEEVKKPANEPVTNNVSVATRDHTTKTFKTAIVIYTMFGHIATSESKQSLYEPYVNLVTITHCFSLHQSPSPSRLAWSLRVEARPSTSKFQVVCLGSSLTLLSRVPETLSEGILQKIHAPPKPDYPVITPGVLATYDAFMFGIPTRFGNYPAQWQTFWDSTGGLWASGALAGKYAGVFVSTSEPGGGQESTVYNALSALTHHGIIYVPLGYKHAFPQLTNLEEVHGGT